jgi:acyl dehydratase
MTTAMLYWEDFSAGHSAEYGDYLVTREEIVAFAAEYDPQPFHLDEEAGRASLLGGLAASGWHTCAIGMRMICDAFMTSAAGLGSPGIEEVRWLAPVRPGDRLTLHWSVLETRPTSKRPDRGLVKFRFELVNQAGERVLVQTNVNLFTRREAAV